MGQLLPAHGTPPHQGVQDVQEPEELHHHQAGSRRALFSPGVYTSWGAMSRGAFDCLFLAVEMAVVVVVVVVVLVLVFYGVVA